MRAVHTARDLRPGDTVIFNWGAYYAPARAMVLGHFDLRRGDRFITLTVESPDPETGELHYYPHFLEGTSRPTLQGIGWQAAE